MLNDFNCNCPIYLASGYTDLRRGIDGLATIIEKQFKLESCTNALFSSVDEERIELKVCIGKVTDFCFCIKGLKKGKFQWPRKSEECVTITPQQYRWLMEGLNIMPA